MSFWGFRIQEYVTQRSLGHHVACCLIQKKELEPKEAKRRVHHPTARFQAPSPVLLNHKAGNSVFLCLNRDLGGGARGEQENQDGMKKKFSFISSRYKIGMVKECT